VSPSGRGEPEEPTLRTKAPEENSSMAEKRPFICTGRRSTLEGSATRSGSIRRRGDSFRQKRPTGEGGKERHPRRGKRDFQTKGKRSG